MNLSVHEQLKDIEKQKSKKEKIAKLIEYVNSTKALAIILDLTFNPKIKWLLPPGAPPYNPSDHLDNQNVYLRRSARRQLLCRRDREDLRYEQKREGNHETK